MLSRYKIVRGKKADYDAIPKHQRQDTRKHTSHPLRPTPEIVEKLLAEPTHEVWLGFRDEYLAVLKERYAEDPTPFERVADKAREDDVYLGCSCPTKAQPHVGQCHTVLALRFMQEKYPDLDVVFPEGVTPNNQEADTAQA